MSGITGRLVLESWVYPDGSRLLEVSLTCRPASAPRIAAAAGRFLVEWGVDLTAPQQTKTGASLACFTA